MPAREFIRLPITTKLLTRIFSKIRVSTEKFHNGVPCWEWTGNRMNQYGTMSYNGRRGHAHRIIYQIFVEAIPVDMVCDHLCRNRRCVNPVHIEPVTNRENTLRGEAPSAIAAKRNHCNKGHELVPSPPTHNTRRYCPICAKSNQAVRSNRHWTKLTSLPYDHPRRVAERERVRIASIASRLKKKMQQESVH